MKIRYCPDCESRTLEKHQRLCSECSFVNRKLTVDMSQVKHRKAMNERQLKYYHKTKMLRSDYKRMALA